MAELLAAAFWSRPLGAVGPATRAHVFTGVATRPLCSRRLVAAGDAGEPAPEQRCTWCARKLREGRARSITKGDRRRAGR